MKSIFAIAALLGVTASISLNGEYPRPRRLDTNLVAFVDDEPTNMEDSFIQTDAVKKPKHRDYVGVRFVTQDDHKFNDELYKLNNITYLGNHGFLIQGSQLDYSGWKRKIEGEEDVK